MGQLIFFVMKVPYFGEGRVEYNVLKLPGFLQK